MTRITDLPANWQTKIACTDRHVFQGTQCWFWTGGVNSRGYGVVWVTSRAFLSHRVAYELLVGPIPDKLEIDHLCEVKRCCNPAHLEPVTHLVNMSRTAQARKTHCTHGHPLSGTNLLIKPRANGRVIRNCRTCRDSQRNASRLRASA